ncbi:MAG: aspartate/glutamate racemase family protein [Pseudomonadota bacterium]
MKRLGMLTPSSNTVLEPMTNAILAGLPDVSAHFGRFEVTEIALSGRALGQFQSVPMVEAARLLSHAKVDTICWNGTSAGWLGFGADEQLAADISAATGIPTSSSVLAINEIFGLTGLRRFALVTPYTDDVQARIVATYRDAGWDCVAEEHLGISVNFDFSEVPESQLADMCRKVADADPEAILIFCTNLWGAAIVEELEREIGIPIYDTVSTAVWAALRAVGESPALVQGWGRLFREVS